MYTILKIYTCLVGVTPGHASVMLVPARAIMCAAVAEEEDEDWEDAVPFSSTRKAEMSLLCWLESNRRPSEREREGWG